MTSEIVRCKPIWFGSEFSQSWTRVAASTVCCKPNGKWHPQWPPHTNDTRTHYEPAICCIDRNTSWSSFIVSSCSTSLDKCAKFMTTQSVMICIYCQLNICILFILDSTRDACLQQMRGGLVRVKNLLSKVCLTYTLSLCNRKILVSKLAIQAILLNLWKRCQNESETAEEIENWKHPLEFFFLK